MRCILIVLAVAFTVAAALPSHRFGKPHQHITGQRSLRFADEPVMDVFVALVQALERKNKTAVSELFDDNCEGMITSVGTAPLTKTQLLGFFDNAIDTAFTINAFPWRLTPIWDGYQGIIIGTASWVSKNENTTNAFFASWVAWYIALTRDKQIGLYQEYVPTQTDNTTKQIAVVMKMLDAIANKSVADLSSVLSDDFIAEGYVNLNNSFQFNKTTFVQHEKNEFAQVVNSAHSVNIVFSTANFVVISLDWLAQTNLGIGTAYSSQIRFTIAEDYTISRLFEGAIGTYGN